MLCSSCGRPLGAVAHIYEDKLFCEDCFGKIQDRTNDPAHTIIFGQHSDEERAKASQLAPDENITIASADQPGSPPIQIPHPSLLLPGEKILWKRTFSKGIIHRHPTVIEVITNMRILVVDDVLKAIVRAVLLSDTTMVVTNTRRLSTNIRTGYVRRGAYMSTGSGSSVTYGDVEFVVKGEVVFTLHHVRDPFGVKNLLQASVKSTKS